MLYRKQARRNIKMESTRQEQLEALETLVGFNEKLLKNMRIIIKELSGKRLDDTDQFLKGIVDAMNWEISVVNGTLELLNEGTERINKVEFNERILFFAETLKSNEDEKKAEAIRLLIPEFEKLTDAAREVIGQ